MLYAAGLADVLAALPPALAARGHDVITVVPRYSPYEGVEPTGISVPLELPSLPLPLPPVEKRLSNGPAPEAAAAGIAEPACEILPGAGCSAAATKTAAAADCDMEPSGEPTSTDRSGEEGASNAGSAGSLPHSADLWLCEQGGVQRVFVDHPLFTSSDIYGSTAGGGKSVYTYLEAGDCSDLELRYSVLCQAALAAPVLLEQQQQAKAGGAPAAGQPQQTIVYVANDWPTALLLLRLQYSVRAAAAAGGPTAAPPAISEGGIMSCADLQQLLAQRLGASAAAAYCIHNLAYQGILSAESFPRLSLPAEALPALCTSRDWREVLEQLEGLRNTAASRQLEQEQALGSTGDAAAGAPGTIAATDAAAQRGGTMCLHVAAEVAEIAAGTGAVAAAPAVAAPAEAGASCSSGQLNQMRSALLAADCLVTVSQGYAAEVQLEGPLGCGLNDILAARGISGIMNGLDIVEWDPATDPHIPVAGRYTAATVAAGKAQMKAWLQERLGLEVNPDAPLIGFVGRLTQQKGVDVLLGATPALLADVSPPPPAPSRWRPPGLVTPQVTHTAAAAGSAPGSSAGEAAAAGGSGSGSGSGSAGQPGSGESGSSGSGTSTGRRLRGRKNARRAAVGGGGLPASPPARQPALVGGAVGNALRSAHMDVPAAQDAGVQIVLLGTGEAWMETALVGLEQSFPRRAVGLTTFSEELAHWIMAASDFVLVPSRFEPCGLVAQAAVRYGAVPIVCAVGGLKDLVTQEVGYTMPAFCLDGTAADHRQNVQHLVRVVRQAASEYGSARYRAMQQRCMAIDVSWEQPAAEWEQLLQKVAAAQLQRASKAVH